MTAHLLTATSTVFSCPTRLISEVHVLRVITAAMKTNPLLFVAFDAVICAPSGDQLSMMSGPGDCIAGEGYSPQSSEESAAWRILEGFLHLCFELPICRSPYFDGPIV